MDFAPPTNRSTSTPNPFSSSSIQNDNSMLVFRFFPSDAPSPLRYCNCACTLYPGLDQNPFGKFPRNISVSSLSRWLGLSFPITSSCFSPKRVRAGSSKYLPPLLYSINWTGNTSVYLVPSPTLDRLQPSHNKFRNPQGPRRSARVLMGLLKAACDWEWSKPSVPAMSFSASSLPRSYMSMFFPIALFIAACMLRPSYSSIFRVPTIVEDFICFSTFSGISIFICICGSNR